MVRQSLKFAFVQRVCKFMHVTLKNDGVVTATMSCIIRGRWPRCTKINDCTEYCTSYCLMGVFAHDNIMEYNTFLLHTLGIIL